MVRLHLSGWSRSSRKSSLTPVNNIKNSSKSLNRILMNLISRFGSSNCSLKKRGSFQHNLKRRRVRIRVAWMKSPTNSKNTEPNSKPSTPFMTRNSVRCIKQGRKQIARSSHFHPSSLLLHLRLTSFKLKSKSTRLISNFSPSSAKWSLKHKKQLGHKSCKMAAKRKTRRSRCRPWSKLIKDGNFWRRS